MLLTELKRLHNIYVMKRKYLDFQVWKKRMLKDPKIKAEYKRLQPEYAVIKALLRARNEYGLTQEDLAERVGTKQSAIARLESGKANPSIAFLQKIADAVDSNLEIKFVPK